MTAKKPEFVRRHHLIHHEPHHPRPLATMIFTARCCGCQMDCMLSSRLPSDRSHHDTNTLCGVLLAGYRWARWLCGKFLGPYYSHLYGKNSGAGVCGDFKTSAQCENIIRGKRVVHPTRLMEPSNGRAVRGAEPRIVACANNIIEALIRHLEHGGVTMRGEWGPAIRFCRWR